MNTDLHAAILHIQRNGCPEKDAASAAAWDTIRNAGLSNTQFLRLGLLLKAGVPLDPDDHQGDAFGH